MKTPALTPATRRGFLRAATALGGAALAAPARAADSPPSPASPAPTFADFRHGDETILILLYPGFTALDAMGPEYMFSGMMGATVRFIARTLDPVKTESGFFVTPHLTFDQCPAKPTVVLVPGGASGTLAALGDAGLLAFLRDVAPRATFMASVCTGSLLLGAAGLLQDYQATSHWQTLELLPLFGAKPSPDRVVIDRNRVTGAGVTAGLDLGLTLVRHFRGDLYAKGTQLLAQYDPQPPFPAEGNPRTADPGVVKLLNEMHKPFIDRMGEAIQAARKAP